MKRREGFERDDCVCITSGCRYDDTQVWILARSGLAAWHGNGAAH